MVIRSKPTVKTPTDHQETTMPVGREFAHCGPEWNLRWETVLTVSPVDSRRTSLNDREEIRATKVFEVSDIIAVFMRNEDSQDIYYD